MIWTTCKLLNPITASDALGNAAPTGSYETIGMYQCMPTPWSNAQLELEGRTVTEADQQFTLRATSIPGAHYCEVDGVVYEITRIGRLYPRFVLIGTRVYKK